MVLLFNGAQLFPAPFFPMIPDHGLPATLRSEGWPVKLL
jgi:hypothetical protein